MKEWQRTVILVILLLTAVGFIVYLHTGYQHHILHVLSQ